MKRKIKQMYISYFVIYIYHLWKKLEARHGVAYDFGNVWYVWENKVFWKGTWLYSICSKLYMWFICGYFGTVHLPFWIYTDYVFVGCSIPWDLLCLTRLNTYFVFYDIYNDYENLVCEKMHSTWSILNIFLV